MKKTLLFTVLIFLIISCSSLKNTQQAINNGNYDSAINTAIKNLKRNKTKKGNQPYILLLEAAFKKVTVKDLAKINFLKKNNNPEDIETIFVLYEQLKRRQEVLKPLLPLYITKENRNANFQFTNYDDAIIENKNQLSDYLYTKVKKLFNANTKYDYRAAYEDLEHIEKINPNYKNVRSLTNIARERGLDFVIVSMKNQTQKVIPKRLEEDMLNFNTSGLNDFWTVYHGTKNNKIKYDFGLELNLRNIQVSPEQVREKEIIKEKDIKDGFTYLLDNNGDQVLDNKGNKIKVDKIVTVLCEVYQFTQFKSAKVTGQVKYIDINTKQITQTYQIASEFIFQHRYAQFKGDKRALEPSFIDLIRLREIQFPSNEMMIYNSCQGFKKKLKFIVNRNKFRN